jgi:hypothetical protein
MQIDPFNASKIFSDEYSMKILAASFHYPQSAQKLSEKYQIPIAVCYRKIHELEDAGFLECVDRTLTQEGRRVKIYRSQVKGAYFFFENGKLRVHLALNKIPKMEVDETVDIINEPL